MERRMISLGSSFWARSTEEEARISTRVRIAATPMQDMGQSGRGLRKELCKAGSRPDNCLISLRSGRDASDLHTGAVLQIRYVIPGLLRQFFVTRDAQS